MVSVKYIVFSVLHAFGRFIFWVTTPVFRYLYEGSHRNLPPVSNPLLMKSAVELSKLIRTRQVKSVDVVNAFIDRIGVINPYVNAVVADRFEEAVAEATKVDALLDSEVIPDEFSEFNAPFLGVPFTTKEAISIASLPNTSGLLIRRDVVSSKDADAIACLRRAGGIPLAITNISELCMWYESSNLIYGRSKNAYHQGRMVGGSSGGEGCLLSAGGSPMGIGSDIGGSIRMPAFFNGIFGHKCTTGVISNAGQFPNAKSGAQLFLSTGPLCRYASDLLPMFKTLILPDQKARLRLDDKVDVKKLRVFYAEDDGGGLLMSPVHPEIKEAIRKAVNHFEKDLGCSVQKLQLPQLKHSFEIWTAMMATSGDDTFCTLLGNYTEPINPFVELLYWIVGRGRHTLPAIMLGIGEKIKNTSEAYEALRRKRDDLKNKLTDILGEDGIFLYPTHPVPAPYHNQALLVLFNFAYTGIFNVLGLPVTAVPMGVAKEERVPVGIQVVGAPYNDRMCLAAAEELGRAFGGWVPPFTTQ